MRGLLEQGQSTLNGKLMETARAVLQRHHERIPDATTLSDTIEKMRKTFANASGKLSLGESNGRKAGGLALRSSAMAEADGSTAANAMPVEPTAA